jgi:signal transduction histidine kinase
MRESLRAAQPEWLRRLLRVVFYSSIRYQIILPYLILTIIVATVGAWIVIRLVVSRQEDRLANQLLENGRVVADEMVRQAHEHFSTAWNIALTEGMEQALQQGDLRTATILAEPLTAFKTVEYVIVADAQGREALHEHSYGGNRIRSYVGQFAVLDLPMVRRLIEVGDPTAPAQHGLALHPLEGMYYYFTAVPVGTEDIVGIVVVGTSLDTLLGKFKDVSRADVVVYRDGGYPIATTFTHALKEGGETVSDLIQIPPIEAARYDSILYSSKLTLSEGIIINERAYRLAWGPLRIGDDTLAVYGVALSMDFVIVDSTASRTTYGLFFGLGALAVILIGSLISRSITGSLRHLVRTSQAVAEGDLAQRTDIVREDEIGFLAETFDEMTHRLWERTEILEETLGRMQAILAGMNDGVMMEDLAGNLHTLNAAAEVMLQEMAANFMFGPLRDLSSIADQDQEPDADVASTPWLLPHRKFEVGSKTISVHSSPVHTEDGERLGTVVVMRDVTVEVAAERLKDEFITHVSHELRTPLTAIKGYSDLLLFTAADVLSEDQHGFVVTIGRNTDDLIAMVNELLDFSEMEASGRLGVLRRPTRLPDLMEDILDDWLPRMKDKGLKCHLEMPLDLPPIHADVRRLRWAIIHLVRNALQYTPAGGRVAITLSATDDHVSIAVEDTGIGISPEDQAHLFSRFYRVTNMPEEDVRGLGVGLYLTKAIVEAHGGEIQVVSERGVGSTFTVTLPVLESEEDNAHNAKA